MNHPQASLVVQVARETLDGDIGPEDHVRQHAVVADRQAAAGERLGKRSLITPWSA